MADIDFIGGTMPFGAGIAIGAIAFLFVAWGLLPVLRHGAKISMLRGVAGLAVSFAVLVFSMFVVNHGAQKITITFAGGEVVGFLGCLAVFSVLVTRRLGQ